MKNIKMLLNIYIYRKIFNTINILTAFCDNVDYEFIKRLINDLKIKIPKWYNNTYYKEITSKRRKGRDMLFFLFPVVGIRFILLKRQIQGVIRKLTLRNN